MYVNRLKELGIKKQLNKTRLTDRLLECISEEQEQHDGRNTVLFFKEGMRNMLKKALKESRLSEDAVILAKAATIAIRKRHLQPSRL